MSKSPNTDTKERQKTGSCWGCENWSGSGRKCLCGTPRAEAKERLRREFQSGEHGALLLEPCTGCEKKSGEGLEKCLKCNQMLCLSCSLSWCHVCFRSEANHQEESYWEDDYWEDYNSVYW